MDEDMDKGKTKMDARTELAAEAGVDRLLQRLECVTETANGWQALCPAHGDTNPSLSIGIADDGKVLLHCHAGCVVDDILPAMGATAEDLRPGQREGAPRAGPPPDLRRNTATRDTAGCGLLEYSKAKRLPVSFLDGLRIKEVQYQGADAVRIPYLDSNRKEIAVRFRTSLSKEGDTDDRFRWRKGSHPSLYGLWRLEDAREAGFVVLVEGESDCHTLWLHGIPALGIPGSGNWNDARDSRFLADIGCVYFVVEPDDGGRALLESLSRSSIVVFDLYFLPGP